MVRRFLDRFKQRPFSHSRLFVISQFEGYKAIVVSQCLSQYPESVIRDFVRSESNRSEGRIPSKKKCEMLGSSVPKSFSCKQNQLQKKRRKEDGTETSDL
jgi:hypothetical protein